MRIPHPYTFADAMQWISAANTRPGERTFLILREDDVVGACSFDLREGPEPELGYWIGAYTEGEGCHRRRPRPSLNMPSPWKITPRFGPVLV